MPRIGRTIITIIWLIVAFDFTDRLNKEGIKPVAS